jgi:hypothetical protein
MVCWIAGYEFWILPRLFDESLTFYDSFRPGYTFEATASGQGYYRITLLLMFLGFVAWVMSQPTQVQFLFSFFFFLFSFFLVDFIAHFFFFFFPLLLSLG